MSPTQDLGAEGICSYIHRPFGVSIDKGLRLCMGTGQADWRDLVPRFRALRESLLSHGTLDAFVAAAFEASADACLRAGDFGEFLKAVQHLNLTIYPALVADDQAGAHPALASFPFSKSRQAQVHAGGLCCVHLMCARQCRALNSSGACGWIRGWQMRMPLLLEGLQRTATRTAVLWR